MKFRYAYAIALMVLLFTAGCRETPTEGTVRDAMTRYLAARHLSIRFLEIGEISGGSMNTQAYMGNPAYTIVIKSITLEATQDIFVPVPMKKGQSTTYSNVRIKVREKGNQQDNWEVSVISGMPML